MNFCTNCGIKLQPVDNFCGNCGKKIAKEVEQEVEQPVEQEVEQPVEQPVEQKSKLFTISMVIPGKTDQPTSKKAAYLVEQKPALVEEPAQEQVEEPAEVAPCCEEVADGEAQTEEVVEVQVEEPTEVAPCCEEEQPVQPELEQEVLPVAEPEIEPQAEEQEVNKTEEQAEVKNKFCNYCGSPVAESAEICPTCGCNTVMQEESSTQTEVQPVATAPVQTAPLAEEKATKFCSYCGSAISKTATVCLKCGCPTGVAKTTTNTASVKKFSILSVVGFIFSFLTYTVGLIISIIALIRINKCKQKGKGLAIAGIIISIVDIVMYIVNEIVFANTGYYLFDFILQLFGIY